MKKIIPGLILVASLFFLASPFTAMAQDFITQCTIRRGADTALITDCSAAPCLASAGGKLDYQHCAICCVMDMVYTVTWWLFFFILALSIIFILYGGFLIVAAGGSEERVTKGRMFIMWALIGFAVAILARVLPLIVRFFVS